MTTIDFSIGPLRRNVFAVVASCLVIFHLSAFSEEERDDVSRVTYTKDVAPIFQDHCAVCHRPGQIAPMSLMTYEECRPWAKSIRNSVHTREMPPFHATGPIGRYEDDSRLTEEEINTVVRWVNDGAQLGRREDLPPPREWDTDPWPMGEPDLIIAMPRYHIQKDGTDDYVDLYSDYVFPESVWIRGVDIRSSNPRAMHHAIVFLTKEDTKIPENLLTREMKSDIFSFTALDSWFPGKKLQEFRAGTAKQIPKGRQIFVNTHYAPTEDDAWDQTLIGIYYANGVISRLDHQMGFLYLGKQIDIPPNVSDFPLTMKSKFKTDAYVSYFTTHMHLRGKSVEILFRYPDGRDEVAFAVPRYDFNWQREYHLTEPMMVPKGTVAECTLTWDNSADNIFNPDPSQRVKAGLRTIDEMGAAAIGYVVPGERLEPPLTVRNGREVRDE